MTGITTNRRALIIGGSISGLLAAKVLSRHFDEVIVLEKDVPDGAKSRRGVPQSNQPHILLSKGYRILQDIFPDIEIDLFKAGAVPIDWGKDFSFCVYGGCNARSTQSTDLVSVSCSRPLLESVIRARVTPISSLIIHKGYRVERLIRHCSNSVSVEFSKLDSREKVKLHADLVVDASGRASKGAKWLEQLGYSAPQSDVVDAKLSYATQRYRAPESGWHFPKALVISHEAPYQKTLAYLALVENNEFIATLGGYCEERPPITTEGFLAYAMRLPNSQFYEAIKQAEPVSKIFAYGATANRLVRYDLLKHMPANFISLGDSVCALCPAYGQGLTVTALSAVCLSNWLEYTFSLQKRLEPIAFQKRLAQSIQLPWMMATALDADFIDDKSSQMNALVRQFAKNYLKELVVRSQQDSHLNVQLTRITHMIDSPIGFLHPRLILGL
jgi:2-polyprenyl-6-methoxyphenol hydroxylase-like FAD-dependent oxidoreductase